MTRGGGQKVPGVLCGKNFQRSAGLILGWAAHPAHDLQAGFHAPRGWPFFIGVAQGVLEVFLAVLDLLFADFYGLVQIHPALGHPAIAPAFVLILVTTGVGAIQAAGVAGSAGAEAKHKKTRYQSRVKKPMARAGTHGWVDLSPIKEYGALAYAPYLEKYHKSASTSQITGTSHRCASFSPFARLDVAVSPPSGLRCLQWGTVPTCHSTRPLTLPSFVPGC